MKKISVIIPIYNAEKYLEQCIKSVMDQTLKDIEIICVDDGSTDKSPKIIDEFAKKDSRIIVIHKKNTGYGNSVNEGINKAKGEYIGIVESDDFITKTMYQTLYSMSLKGTVDVIKSNFWDCYDEDDGSITKVENTERAGMPDVGTAFNIREYPQILWGHPSIWTAIYRRQFLIDNKITFKEAKGGGWVDNPFFFDTLFSADKIKWTKTPFYCYRKTNENSSSIGYDLKLPFERMEDNFSVAQKHNCVDNEIQKNMYARALMYLIGATQEENYAYKEDYVKPYMQKMLDRMNPDVIFDEFNENDQLTFLKYRSPITTLMPKTSKLLIYNWLPFDNPDNIGGGVTIYCRNLISYLLRKRPDIQVYFISSGWAYDIKENTCYVRRIENIFGDRCRSFEIVNSPVPAPQDMLFKNPSFAFKNELLKNTFDDFIKNNGPFDAIHFNNIEGLSFDVLGLKKKYTDTKFIYSMHNYVPICMTGFYYMRDKHKNCSNKHTSRDCDNCIDRDDNRRLRTEMIGRAKFNVPDAQKYNEDEWSATFDFEQLNKVCKASLMTDFTKKATAAINENMDIVLAVSERVKQIAIENGIDAKLVKTDYIGTKIACHQIRKSRSNPKDKYFKVVYLGAWPDYEEKGYPFLIEALSQLDTMTAMNINLVMTLKVDNKDEYIRKKLDNFHSVTLIHGYGHRDLEQIMQEAHLGVVPVLWEDNLPQIAIEMVALGVPVLSSDAGGATELCNSELFKFKAGDKSDFLSKLKYLFNNRNKLDEYWKHHNGLVTMEAHIDKICDYYGLERKEDKKIEISQDEYIKMIEENEFLYKHMIKNDSVQYIEKLVLMNNEAELIKRDEELENIKKERDYLQYCLNETRKSKTYKLGQAITAIPKILKKGH